MDLQLRGYLDTMNSSYYFFFYQKIKHTVDVTVKPRFCWVRSHVGSECLESEFERKILKFSQIPLS